MLHNSYMESWKEIPGHKGYYASDLGRIKSCINKNHKILKPFRVGEYLGVWLGAGNKRSIHRIVALAWYGESEPDLVVDHIDRNKKNNCKDNLRYVSQSANNINKNLETKKRANSSSAEHHIFQDTKNYYRVKVCQESMSTNTLEEAIFFRDAIIDSYHAI